MDLVKTAIDRIRQFEPTRSTLFEKEKYQVGISGGKDSECIARLMRLSGVPFQEHYNVTTIDPPEVVYHLRKYHPDVIWNYPKTPLLTRMVVKECFPPLRNKRWCCKWYKERVIAGGMTVLGLRNSESVNRGKRRMVKACWNDPNKRYLNPIIDWTEDDVWKFIADQKITPCSLYDEGWTRLGCIGCPMAGKGRLKQFERWPGYGRLWKKLFQRMFDMRKRTGMKLYNWKSWEEMWDWWIEDKQGAK